MPFHVARNFSDFLHRFEDDRIDPVMPYF